ncbi:MAG: hypothetical protein LLG06_03360 [Desulfobacteraceae bacterium]|nr:hypothetical protein [Desulfobacteraceae bacterium]
MKKLFVFLLFFLLIAWICMSHAAMEDVLFGISINSEAGTVSIDVSSTGCTDKSYYNAALESNILTFKRIRRDECKAMPRRHTLVYTFAELGLKRNSHFQLGNPIVISDNFF